MKRLFIAAIILLSCPAFAQSTSTERDSVAQSREFQTKVKLAAHVAAGNLLADPAQPNRVRQYSQLIISSPYGQEWLAALSYGVMSNPAINWNSADSDVQFTVNSIIHKYAFAYYREQPVN